MEGSKMQFVLISVAIFSPLFCFGEQALPLIAWSNTRSLTNTPRISAGKVVSREELGTNYMNSILQTQPQNVLLFVFDELSIDDITRYSDAHNSDGQGGAFSHLKTAMSESLSHLVLPAVEPGDLERDLSSKVNGAVVDLNEPALDGLNFDLSKTNLVVKHFSVASGNGDLKYEAFSDADKIIDSLVQSQKTRYTAILTAKHKSKIEPKSVDGDRLTVGRRLLSSDDTSETFIAHYNTNDTKCNLYMTASKLVLVMHSADKDTTIELPVNYTSWSTEGSSCANYPTVTLEMTLVNGSQPELDKFTLSLSFSISSLNFWNILPTSFVEMAYKGTEATKHNLTTDITDTPLTFSYHCSDTVFKLLNKTGDNSQLKITEFQIQPYIIMKKDSVDQYGRANDCVGFFTEGIWMGLFLGLIVLVIVFFGFGMILNLKVMDKFDDPKGKTITINTSAE